MARGYLTLALYLVGSYVFFRFVFPLVLPFVLALFLAIAVDPIVTGLERRRGVPRSVGAATVIMLILGILGLVFFLTLVRLGTELVGVSSSLPLVYVEVTRFMEMFSRVFGEFIASLPPSLEGAFFRQFSTVYQSMQGILSDALGILTGLLQALPNLALIFLITALATYLVSRDKETVREFALGLLPGEWRSAALTVKARLLTSAVGLLRAQGILVILTFLVILVGLTLLGAEYALSIAMASAVLDVIPVLGPALVFLPWASYHLLVGEAGFGVGILFLYIVVATLRGIAQAYVIGGNIGLHPLSALIALFLGFRFFGAAGVVYGPIIAVVLKAMVEAGLISLKPRDG